MNVKNNPPLKRRDSKCKALNEQQGTITLRLKLTVANLYKNKLIIIPPGKIAKVKKELF